MGDWQPIETAPRDGRKILGYDGGFTIVNWDNCFELWEVEPTAEYENDLIRYPTHWMPLPEPPK